MLDLTLILGLMNISELSIYLITRRIYNQREMKSKRKTVDFV